MMSTLLGIAAVFGVIILWTAIGLGAAIVAYRYHLPNRISRSDISVVILFGPMALLAVTVAGIHRQISTHLSPVLTRVVARFGKEDA